MTAVRVGFIAAAAVQSVQLIIALLLPLQLHTVPNLTNPACGQLDYSCHHSLHSSADRFAVLAGLIDECSTGWIHSCSRCAVQLIIALLPPLQL